MVPRLLAHDATAQDGLGRPRSGFDAGPAGSGDVGARYATSPVEDVHGTLEKSPVGKLLQVPLDAPGQLVNLRVVVELALEEGRSALTAHAARAVHKDALPAKALEVFLLLKEGGRLGVEPSLWIDEFDLVGAVLTTSREPTDASLVAVADIKKHNVVRALGNHLVPCLRTEMLTPLRLSQFPGDRQALSLPRKEAANFVALPHFQAAEEMLFVARRELEVCAVEEAVEAVPHGIYKGLACAPRTAEATVDALPTCPQAAAKTDFLAQLFQLLGQPRNLRDVHKVVEKEDAMPLRFSIATLRHNAGHGKLSGVATFSSHAHSALLRHPQAKHAQEQQPCPFIAARSGVPRAGSERRSRQQRPQTDRSGHCHGGGSQRRRSSLWRPTHPERQTSHQCPHA
mmetsp:Transcript_5392/g.13477  ORF Transcript_5392/g.13477 Transcript_5392/m.13477 type:complete len:399 (-) Transcript_5392:43-1239(-)